MLEGEKNNLQAHTPRKKKFIVIQDVEKKFMTRPNHPAPTSKVKWSAPKIRSLKRLCHIFSATFKTQKTYLYHLKPRNNGSVLL